MQEQHSSQSGDCSGSPLTMAALIVALLSVEVKCCSQSTLREMDKIKLQLADFQHVPYITNGGL